MDREKADVFSNQLSQHYMANFKYEKNGIKGRPRCFRGKYFKWTWRDETAFINIYRTT
jgi:hypothetical protein